MTQASYGQFCPVAMAAEVLCTRWTMLVVRELVSGSTRFNDLRRGVPRMSRTLLSRRLKELEHAGIVERRPVPGEHGVQEYRLTSAGEDLYPVVEAFGLWGQKWVQSDVSLQKLDPSLLMWDMRRNLDPSPLPSKRLVVQFRYTDLAPANRSWWLVVQPSGDVDLCRTDPGFEIDLYVETDLRTMTAVWMGLATVATARRNMSLDGDPEIVRTMQSWLGLSPFAAQPKLVP
ncbi:winged helix-turn-helix transcriptional regulator [Tranquillimonas alkanivorans]|uniref:Transcriptional regulator, HxlR family n=1 Tax=Tranquillimonas alkanivorans TaxID=441119 RepID=A0A1I5THI0_9RHOB|nr:helix-turn-helix domain-containing protein [Tranquillimonas alkanivorans]SFP82524.1 transcriptional regulator, HxlR family [Tranquillimonas alkanivorans]